MADPRRPVPSSPHPLIPSSPRPPVAGPAGLIGRTLGPYRIEAFLGRGGMSSVYRAVQVRLDRPVALKLLPPELAGDQVLVARFLQEARAAAGLQHPNIIPVYDSGQVDGYYYIAMRYVDGLPLARAIPERGFPLPRALAIVDQLAAALDYAHARGVIHRDVSAGNVMLEAGDRVTLMDFGIAQAREGSRLTRAGVAVGTLEYLSPEQARGERCTPRSDVYALGVLTYELLTGALPFRAADDRALLLQHLSAAPPSARSARPDLPAGVDAALARCLAKDPQARFPSAGAFAAALRAAVAAPGRGTVVAPAPAPTRLVQPPAPSRAAPPAAAARAASQPASPAPAAAAGATGRPASPRGVRIRPGRRRLRRLALAALALLLLALGAGAAAQHLAGSVGTIAPPVVRPLATAVASRRAGPTATARLGAAATSSTRSTAAAPTATPPAPVAVPPPASPEVAVNAFYSAVYHGIQGDPAGFSLAYSLLSRRARAQLPYANFVRQYAGDSGLVYHYDNATPAPDHQSATVPVDVTEYRGGNPVVSSVTWTVVQDGADGWRLDHATPRQQAGLFLPAKDGHGDGGHGKGGHGKGD